MIIFERRTYSNNRLGPWITHLDRKTKKEVDWSEATSRDLKRTLKQMFKSMKYSSISVQIIAEEYEEDK